MDLIRDVLDNQIVDRDKEKMGKVDGIVIELRDDDPPRLAYLEVGGVTLARRLSRRLGRWAEGWGRRWGANGGGSFCIPWERVRDVGIDVEVDLKADETPPLVWEHRIRKQIIDHIPGAG